MKVEAIDEEIKIEQDYTGPRLQRRLFSFLLSKKVPPVPSKEERKVYPEFQANIISRIFFLWLNPVMKVGYKRALEENDLFVLSDNLKVKNMTDEFQCRYRANFEKKLNSTIKKTATKEKHISEDKTLKNLCVITLFQVFWVQISTSIIFMALSYSCVSFNSLISRKLIQFVEGKTGNSRIGDGVGYAVGTSLMACIGGYLQNHSVQRGMMAGARSKAVLTKAIIEKSFRLSMRSQRRYPSGKIMSMLGADLSRVDKALAFLPLLLSFPVPLIIALVILLVNIGVSSLVAIALLFIFLLTMAFATSKMIVLRRHVNKFTDKRIKYTQEILNNLRMIKLYSWEIPYFDRVFNTRKKEMSFLRKIQTILNFVMAISMSFTTIISMVAFLVLYGVKKKNRNAADIFSSLSLFNMLSQVVYILPQALNSCGDAYVGLSRLDVFLQSEEMDDGHRFLNDRSTFPKSNIAVKAEKCCFTYDVEDMPDATSNSSMSSKKPNMGTFFIEDLEILKGEFIIVSGPTGSGKTSILNAISGFMVQKTGNLFVNGTMVYCGQPWIQNATIRENITFGKPFNATRYDRVIHSCALEKDLSEARNDDLTEIGERGITLSGGQKARISLARAVYADTDIMLLDDVLSAVDAKVGELIMKECIMGVAKDKTRIFATNHTAFFKYADKIIFMKDDGTIDFSKLEDLYSEKPDFRNYMSYGPPQATTEEENYEEENVSKPVSKSLTPAIRRQSFKKLIQPEKRELNGVSISVYRNYIKFGSGIFTSVGWCFGYITFTSLATFSQLFVNVWLSFWITNKFMGRNAGFYIGIYVMLTMTSVTFLVGELLSLVYLSNTASLVLNVKSLKNILFTSMSFMDTTPIGRVLNRFSRDTEVLDNEIGNFLRLSSFTFSMIIGIVIMCIIYLPWFAISIPPMCLIFIVVVSFYQASSREVKRLESLKRSFVYSKFGEILDGMNTLKIYNKQQEFLSQLDVLIDSMNEAYYITISNQRWIGVHLTNVAIVFVLIISLLCVNSVFNVNAASVGLLLSYVLQMVNMLVQLVRSSTQLVVQMNSVERLNEYATEIAQEAPYIITETSPAIDWPQHGSINFENVSMKYRAELPFVLRNFFLRVNPGEKVGICGRTGAGKSSILTALFRLVELFEGKIEIDGLDISKLGLNQLRSRMSIIPQDPVLFEGTIRSNLDPFGKCSDECIIDALSKVGLGISKSLETEKHRQSLYVESKFNLDSEVTENGANFSLGEKQLLSFARALIRNSRILVLDEATSSVDFEFDRRIQESILRDFADCTILCIAHRLRTIIHYDKVLVLERGSVKEFDTPLALFIKGGDFREMCEKSNICESDFT